MLKVKVKISGPFACFTRPETKVERFSYPMMTPSAARNILDAICWRPEMRWVVTSIAVLKPIRFISILRNEVQSRIAPGAVKKWMVDPGSYTPLAAGAGQDTEGTPRNSVLLRDVSYIVEAYPLIFNASNDNTPAKYVAMLQRRVEKGQCHHQPALGCREFAADFSPPLEDDVPLPLSQDLGRMLYDIAFLPDGNRAAFFNATLQDGVMDTRPELVLQDNARREEVLRCSYKR
ncbi:MAG TPA: type I-C CRISPR-associated protein Cas5c [Candidatus Angelobacter sp.]|nr:type I-C CRISPR-associated protein Cas5c [Candidatus Angelobacter sp.]